MCAKFTHMWIEVYFALSALVRFVYWAIGLAPYADLFCPFRAVHILTFHIAIHRTSPSVYAAMLIFSRRLSTISSAYLSRLMSSIFHNW